MSKTACPKNVVDCPLYLKVVEDARARFKRYPSVYASMWIQREYKKRGGGYRGRRPSRQKGVTRWLAEKWVQVIPYLTTGKVVACGAPNRHTKACRPLVRISDKTPVTIPELLKVHSKATLLRLARSKNRDMGRRIYWRRGHIAGGAANPGRRVRVSDKMQKGYTYTRTEPPGKNFAPDFTPHLTPAEMLVRGVFEGKYLNDCRGEFPAKWFRDAQAAGKLRPEGADPAVNEFGVKSRKSLGYWRRKGWIPIAEGDRDVRGWFQWYCRYWMGRRMPAIDAIQIKRWRAFSRHAGQIRASYRRLGAARPRTKAQKRRHRSRQRQALLQWAHDPYV